MGRLPPRGEILIRIDFHLPQLQDVSLSLPSPLWLSPRPAIMPLTPPAAPAAAGLRRPAGSLKLVCRAGRGRWQGGRRLSWGILDPPKAPTF